LKILFLFIVLVDADSIDPEADVYLTRFRKLSSQSLEQQFHILGYVDIVAIDDYFLLKFWLSGFPAIRNGFKVTLFVL